MENKTSKGLGIRARRIIAYIVLIFITIMCLFWFYILAVNATRSNANLTKGFSLLFGDYAITNWVNLQHGTLPIWSGLINSCIVSTCAAVLCTYFSAMTAYGIHAYRFKGRKAISSFILAVMMIPTQVTALGFLQIIGKMGLEDSFIPLIVPAIASPVTYFYMKQYLDSSLPLSIVESARIDGAGEMKTFNAIVLPIIKPALAVQLIFAFVSNWNNYFTPALVLHTDSKKTLPILIAQLRAADFLKFDMGQVYMMIAFSILPVVVVYLFLSKYIVQGVTAGAVKG